MLKVLLLADKWIDPSEDLVLKVNNKWAKMFDSTVHLFINYFK